MRPGWDLRLLAATLGVSLLTGCGPDNELAKLLDGYQGSAASLGQATERLFANANVVEAESTIDRQVFAQGALSADLLNGQAILSPAGLQLRKDAIEALSTYTLALAELASGKTEGKIATDAAAVAIQFGLLTTDVQTSLATGSATASTTDYSGAVAGAAAGVGDLIKMLERRHSRTEMRASLRKNDPAIEAISHMLGADAERIYRRKRQAIDQRASLVYVRYTAEIRSQTPNAFYAMSLGEQLKRARWEQELIRAADPAPAFASWTSAHDDLVASILATHGKEQRQAQARLTPEIAAFGLRVKVFAAGVDALTAAPR